MRATVSSVGSGMLRSMRSVGYAAIRGSGQFSPEYDFSQYTDGWRPRGYKLAVGEAKRKCLIAPFWWRTFNGD